MFQRVTVSLAPDRQYTAYVVGERVEIVATIQGCSARMGTGRWTGTAIADCDVPIRADAAAALNAAIRAVAVH